jgi:hypothetical protein
MNNTMNGALIQNNTKLDTTSANNIENSHSNNTPWLMIICPLR